jgi:16S rRNA (cytosine967-C5)-methyltransferase
MRFAGQVQTAIEVLEGIEKSPLPADRFMGVFFKPRRYIGSSDKGVVANLVYDTLRHKAALGYVLGHARLKSTPRTLVLAHLVRSADGVPPVADIFTGERFAPAALTAEEAAALPALKAADLQKAPTHVLGNFPDWLLPHLTAAFGDSLLAEVAALTGRAATDLRVNTLKTTRAALEDTLHTLGYPVVPTPYSPLGLRLPDRRPLFGLEPFQQGHFEIQDEGSQILALLAGASPKMRVVDFCAGAGGKTLVLAAQMRNKGRIDACDVVADRLTDLRPRLARAGADNVQVHVLSSERDAWVKHHKEQADVVLLDVPCTGTGTWRRSPDSKWRLTPDTLSNVCATQASILDSASRLVKPGGRLVYATCSVLPAENHEQVTAFLARTPDFSLRPMPDEWAAHLGPTCPVTTPMLQLTPLRHGTDGFFAAVLQKKA